MRPYLPLNHLRAFEAAARHGSFARAALELRVTPSALGHQVKALEERIGRSLFHRLWRGLSLTPDGAALVPVIQRALDDMAAAVRSLEAAPHTQMVRISTDSAFAFGWLLPRLDRFRSMYPDVDVQVVANDGLVADATELPDLTVTFEAVAAVPGEHTLLEPKFAPVCRPSTAASLGDPSRLEEHPLLASLHGRTWEDWFRKAQLKPLAVRGPAFSSFLGLVEAARRGLGIALAPTDLFEREIRTGELVAPLKESVRAGSYKATVRAARASRAAEALLEWMIGETSEPYTGRSEAKALRR